MQTNDDVPNGDVRYLDLDGDGVPDAVLTLAQLVHDEDTALPTLISTLESGIGIDGRPRDVDTHAHRWTAVPSEVAPRPVAWRPMVHTPEAHRPPRCGRP